ncbi:MAG: hypothetical protein HKP55_05700 [Gammaproteobacteria bacterium]|nr:hypothetical protein [Gammaproteobacteria bacterium]NNJ91148.1 hypothetical protein [Gammaproteobacteria bacterium]
MKKFIAYMSLALVVYLLIYAIMLASLRMQSTAVSDFCGQLESGMSVAEIQAAATQQQLISAFHEDAENALRLLFVSQADNKDAVCQIMIENDRLTQKKFVLSAF